MLPEQKWCTNRRTAIKIGITLIIGIWICYTVILMMNSKTADKHALVKPKGIDDRILAIYREILRMERHLEVNGSESATSLMEYAAKAKKERTKMILVRTTFFGQKPWGWMSSSKRFNHWEGIQCPFFRCRLTFSQNDFLKADAVIFHAKNMLGKLAMDRLLHYKPKAQKWVYFALESPMNNPDADRLNNLFHWTLTYRRDSDFYSPYGYYYPITNNEEKATRAIEKIVKGKTKLAVWIASHCGVKREEYIRELLKYIAVGVYGKCAYAVGLKNESGECYMNDPKCTQLKRRFKFQLAFENSNCLDYITEKYWSALKIGIVPIVLGGSNYNSKVAIPGSYINVMKYKSVKELADYLLYLDKNDKEYSKYFEWRKRYKVADYAPWTCTLCAALNMNTKKTYIARLGDFWSETYQCGITNDAIRRIVSAKGN